MKDNIKVIIYFTIFVLFMIFAYVGYNMLSENRLNSKLNEEKITKKTEKNKLKEFNLYLENGNKISSKQLLVGKPIIINIWTSWCAYCDIEMEYFNELYQKEKDDIVFVMINATGDRDSKEAAKQYIKSNNFSFDVYYDLKLEALTSLGVYSYPTTIFVDKEGYIDSYNVGIITKEKLQSKIKYLK